MLRKTASGRLDLEQIISETYFSLRLIIVVLSVALPLALWLIGRWLYDLPLQDSMSAYYHTPMRNVFVGTLIAASACLHVYKGLSEEENYLLNFAALAQVGIALNPQGWIPSWWFLPNALSPHGICAVAFFIAITLACWLCKEDSFKLGLISESQRRYLARKYTAIAIAMLALPVAAVLIITGVLGRPFDTSVFWIEALAVWSFAYYWYTKSTEIKMAIDQRVAKVKAAGA